MRSRSKLLTLATTTIPRILQIINAATILLHSSFLSIWWSKQQSVANSGCFAPLLALSTFVGAFALVTASTLQFKRLARTVPPMGKIAADGLVATFCVAAGSVTACFLCNGGNGPFCRSDFNTGNSYFMTTSVIWGKCEMVQFALMANTVVFFLCFLASVMLINSTINSCVSAKMIEDRGDTERFGRVEVVQVLAEK